MKKIKSNQYKQLKARQDRIKRRLTHMRAHSSSKNSSNERTIIDIQLESTQSKGVTYVDNVTKTTTLKSKQPRQGRQFPKILVENLVSEGPEKHRKRAVSPPLQISRNSTPKNESTLLEDPDYIDEKEINDYKIDM